MERVIAGFHVDDEGDWVADLSCGHRQHVRHRPPFLERPWVLDAEGRAARVGTRIECPLCDRGEPAAGPVGGDPGAEEGGEAACYAALVCPECGGVIDDAHREQGCRR